MMFYKAAPNGVMYDTPEDIVRKKDLIMQRVVLTKTMPRITNEYHGERTGYHLAAGSKQERR